MNQLMIGKILEKEGHQVTLAENGQQAVKLFIGQYFDCILMDIQMPVMTGTEATRRIREAEGVHGSRFNGSAVEETADGGVVVGAKNLSPVGVTPNAPYSGATPPPTVNREPGTVNQRNRIPIIAVTAHTLAGDRERFLAAGMDDYLSKPVNIKDLRTVLMNIR